MTVTVSVPDQLARRAHTEGLSVQAYVERILQQSAESEAALTTAEQGREAIDRLLAFGETHRLTLGPDIRIKDLLHEGHKY